VDIVVLAISFVVILIGSELFTNGIEWFGHKLELGEGAIGSVLAAIGTALPETMVPLMAILFGGGAAGNQVGVGAILGAPFMLATLAMFVTGVGVWIFRKRRAAGTSVQPDREVVRHDVGYFAVAYAIAIGAAFLPGDWEWPRRLIALALISIYVRHVYVHLQADAAEHEGLEPLRFHKLDRRGPRHPEPPRFMIVAVQVVFALGCIIGGAWAFVQGVEDIAKGSGLNPTLLALLIAPIATELPETLNSVLWVRNGKDTLALGNVTGAMVFQSVIPTSIGLVLAPALWVVSSDQLAFLSAAVAFVSLAAVAGPMIARGTMSARGLMSGGLFYLGYVALVVVALVRPAG
jgi:cation:H+ antiporter